MYLNKPQTKLKIKVGILISLLLLLVLAISLVFINSPTGQNRTAEASFSIASPIISTQAQMVEFRTLVNAGTNFSATTVTLANDIDMSGLVWDVGIGNTFANAFRGTFDGMGHTISNLTGSSGLFGFVASGILRNVNIEGAHIDNPINGHLHIGSLANETNQTTIEKAQVTNSNITHNRTGFV